MSLPGQVVLHIVGDTVEVIHFGLAQIDAGKSPLRLGRVELDAVVVENILAVHKGGAVHGRHKQAVFIDVFPLSHYQRGKQMGVFFQIGLCTVCH